MRAITIPVREHAAPELGLFAGGGGVLGALAGSLATGVALAAGWLAMPWPRAFAAGLFGGALLGLTLGAAIAIVRAALRPADS